MSTQKNKKQKQKTENKSKGKVKKIIEVTVITRLNAAV